MNSLFKFTNWLSVSHYQLRKFATKKMTEKLIWVDCEMSGLNVDHDQLLEIALVITDGNFNKVIILLLILS